MQGIDLDRHVTKNGLGMIHELGIGEYELEMSLEWNEYREFVKTDM